MTKSGFDINFINFNQDCTSLALGTRTGYKLFSLSSVEKMEEIYESSCRDVTIVERLFSSSLIALVSQSSPRRLRVCHFKKGTEICQYSYSNTILAVKLNRARLVVCLEESLYIHNIRDMKVLHTIRDTPPNPKGLCALSINSDNCFLAYPGSTTTGEVQLFDAFNLQAKLMIPAHDSPLAAITFNSSGSRLATASERGTVIRVFSVADGSRLIEFRRGVKRCAHVSSLSFSQDGEYLALSSNTETIHVFKIDEVTAAQLPPEEYCQTKQNGPAAAAEDQGSWMGYLTKAVTAGASYLPTQVTDTLNQTRAYATVTVPYPGVPNIVSIASINRQLRLLLGSYDGYFYIYNIPSGGGECTLAKQHKIETQCTAKDLEDEDDLLMPKMGDMSLGSPGRERATLGSPGGRERKISTTSAADSPAVIPVTQEKYSPDTDESPPPIVTIPDS